MSFESTWSRVKRHAGERFQTVTGKPFSYRIQGEAVRPDRAAQLLGRLNFEKAYELMPLKGPGEISNLVRGSAYVYAILTDPRISGREGSAIRKPAAATNTGHASERNGRSASDLSASRPSLGRDNNDATLVVIACGAAKVWRNNPRLGPVAAKDAYVGAPFKVNREYAEHFAPRDWVILSAKYGFLRPDHAISDYEVTFKRPSTNPIAFSTLRHQISNSSLATYNNKVVVLGGREYEQAAREAFRDTGAVALKPVHGLGTAMAAVKTAVNSDTPLA